MQGVLAIPQRAEVLNGTNASNFLPLIEQNDHDRRDHHPFLLMKYVDDFAYVLFNMRWGGGVRKINDNCINHYIELQVVCKLGIGAIQSAENRNSRN